MGAACKTVKIIEKLYKHPTRCRGMGCIGYGAVPSTGGTGGLVRGGTGVVYCLYGAVRGGF